MTAVRGNLPILLGLFGFHGLSGLRGLGLFGSPGNPGVFHHFRLFRLFGNFRLFRNFRLLRGFRGVGVSRKVRGLHGLRVRVCTVLCSRLLPASRIVIVQVLNGIRGITRAGYVVVARSFGYIIGRVVSLVWGLRNRLMVGLLLRRRCGLLFGIVGVQTPDSFRQRRDSPRIRRPIEREMVVLLRGFGLCRLRSRRIDFP